MIANVIAFLLSIVLLATVEIATGGTTPTVVRFGVGVVIFGIANAINQSRKHSASGDVLTAPILQSDAIPEDGGAAATSVEERAAAESDALLPVGRISDGRLMLSEEELHLIPSKWESYENVFKLKTPPPAMNPAGAVTWYLVLSPQSGVFFDERGANVWTVFPNGINQTTFLKMESADGRTEKIQSCEPMASGACIAAWTCKSWNEFQQLKLPGPSEWGLLAYELMSGRSARSFMRWELPYANVKDGIRKLEAQKAVAVKVAHTLNPKVVEPRLRELGLNETNSLFYVALQGTSCRNIRNTVLSLAAIFLITIYVGAWLSYSMHGISRSSAITIASLVSILAAVGVGASEFWYRRRLADLPTVPQSPAPVPRPPASEPQERPRATASIHPKASTISTRCTNPECGKLFKVSAQALGRVARCKACGTQFKIETS